MPRAIKSAYHSFTQILTCKCAYIYSELVESRLTQVDLSLLKHCTYVLFCDTLLGLYFHYNLEEKKTFELTTFTEQLFLFTFHIHILYKKVNFVLQQMFTVLSY